MKSFLHVLLLWCLFFSPLSLFANERGVAVKAKLEQDSGKRIGVYRALIIGINDYKDEKIPDLSTAVNDAQSVANLLRKSYGFTDVTLLLDRQADGSAIQKSLRMLATTSQPEDSVLIYYAGHGDLDKVTKDGWWIPANATAQDPFTYIDNSIIQKYVKAIPARHVLIIADSCFSGSLFGEARALPSIIDDKYYANLFKEKSRWGMTSGNLTPVSDSGSAGHSVFAYHFLKKLANNRKSYITPREIYQDIAPVISNNSSQMPIAKPLRNAEDQGGEFIFIRTDEGSPHRSKKQPEPESGPMQKLDAEEELWLMVKDSSDAGDFTYFLEQFPSGRFASLAEFKLSKLEEGLKSVKVEEYSKKRSYDGRYIDNGDGTISDTRTGLMWTQKDSYAETGMCNDWNASQRYVSNLDTGGYKDWRFPTISELKSIYEGSKETSSIAFMFWDTIHVDPIFSTGSALSFWSSEEAGSCCARVVNFNTGAANNDSRQKCTNRGVRAVRSP